MNLRTCIAINREPTILHKNMHSYKPLSILQREVVAWWHSVAGSVQPISSSTGFSLSHIFKVTDVAEEAEVSKHSAIHIYQWLREVCTTRHQLSWEI
jgi:hypothetical protein